MSKEKKVTLKGIIKEAKGTKDNKDAEVQIRIKGDAKQEVGFEKFEKDQESDEIEFEYRVKKDGKWPDKWQDGFKSKVKWTGGWVMNEMELINKKVGDVELKETVKPGLGFFGTPTITCWIGIVVVIISLVALIWWWVASSRSEDKEEEGL